MIIENERKTSLERKAIDAEMRLKEQRKRQEMELKFKAELKEMKNEMKDMNQIRKERKVDFIVSRNVEKQQTEDIKHIQYVSSIENLKREKVKTLFDAEFQREELRTCLHEMAVWNVYDTEVVNGIIGKDGQVKKNVSVSDYVRKKAA